MVVMCTNFQHKRIHKITWLSPEQNTATKIDHIITNENKKVVIEDVRSMRGPRSNEKWRRKKDPCAQYKLIKFSAINSQR